MRRRVRHVIAVAVCAGILACHRTTLGEASPLGEAAIVGQARTADEALQSPQNTLALYEAVLRAITASYPRDRHPPVESSIMEWYRREAPMPYGPPVEHFSSLPDTFLTRLAREGVTSGICPIPRCRRVANAISLSPPRSAGPVVVVQASLDGTGL